MSNVNGHQQALAANARLREAARELRAAIGRNCVVARITFEDDPEVLELDAALAAAREAVAEWNYANGHDKPCTCGCTGAPVAPEAGEVVERAARVLLESERMADCNAHLSRGQCHEAASALHAAGLLARPVDREWLANYLAKWRYENGRPDGTTFVDVAPCDYEGADAILREMGGGR